MVIAQKVKHRTSKLPHGPAILRLGIFPKELKARTHPKKLDPRRNTPRHIIIKLPKFKDKEKILKAAREKDTVTYKGVPIRLSADFSKEMGLERSIPSHERQGPTSKIILSSKAII